MTTPPDPRPDPRPDPAPPPRDPAPPRPADASPPGPADAAPPRPADAGAHSGPLDADSDAGPDTGSDPLLGLIDRLAEILAASDLDEIEVEAGGTALRIRKPHHAPPPFAGPPPAPGAPGAGASAAGALATAAAAGATAGPAGAAPEPGPARLSVKAPLTGLFYTAPAPGSAPYVRVGGEVAVGQVIGLIEAMKLFNEIKSDVAGRVVRIAHESGALVKAKQVLIEVEPL